MPRHPVRRYRPRPSNAGSDSFRTPSCGAHPGQPSSLRQAHSPRPASPSSAPTRNRPGQPSGLRPTTPTRAMQPPTNPRFSPTCSAPVAISPQTSATPETSGLTFSAPSAASNQFRRVLCIVLLSLLLPGCLTRRTTSPEAPAQPAAVLSTTSNHDLEDPFMRNDTLFLRDWQQVDTTDGLLYYCRAFVEKTTPESIRNLLSEQWEHDYWQENLALLKQRHPAPFPTCDLHECPTTWLPVNSFRGTLYIDTTFEGPVWLSDSLLVRQSQEGPWPTPLQRVERPDTRHFRLLMADNKQLDIYITDTVRQLAVFAFRDSDNRTYHSLYAPLETASRLDLVVWNCSEIPDYNDVAWDIPDYKALISAAMNDSQSSNTPGSAARRPDTPGSTPCAASSNAKIPSTPGSTPSAAPNNTQNTATLPTTASNNPQSHATPGSTPSAAPNNTQNAATLPATASNNTQSHAKPGPAPSATSNSPKTPSTPASAPSATSSNAKSPSTPGSTPSAASHNPYNEKQ